MVLPLVEQRLASDCPHREGSCRSRQHRLIGGWRDNYWRGRDCEKRGGTLRRASDIGDGNGIGSGVSRRYVADGQGAGGGAADAAIIRQRVCVSVPGVKQQRIAGGHDRERRRASFRHRLIDRPGNNHWRRNHSQREQPGSAPNRRSDW